MNAAPNFSSILDEAPSEVERPKPYPQGSYTAMVKGLPRYDKSSKKQTEFTEFTLQLLSAGDDVDEEALTEVLTSADGTVRPLADMTLKHTCYHTPNSIWRLDEFHEHCGIDLAEEKSRRERNEECAGRQVGIYVKHEASEDGTQVFARIGKTFRPE